MPFIIPCNIAGPRVTVVHTLSILISQQCYDVSTYLDCTGGEPAL
jgi:hypothetical protein